MKNLHTLKAEDVIRHLGSREDGMPLDSPRGENVIFPEKKRTLIDYLLPIVSAPLLILFAVTVIAAFVAEERTLGYVALGAFVLAIYVWYFAYRRTLDKMDEMRALSESFLRVKRDGKLCLVPSEDLVEGDILLLQKGDSLPADCRVLSESALVASEGAVFSGKGRLVKKTAAPCLDSDYTAADNMLWAGSVVHEGTCRAIVCAVGTRTRIASLGEKKPVLRQVSGTIAAYLKRLSLITSSVLLGLLFLVTVFGLTPLSNGLFRDWLLFVSFAGTAAVELFGLILTVACSRAFYFTRGLVTRRVGTVEAFSHLDIAIVSASHFRNPAHDGIHTLLLPSAEGVMLEKITPDLSPSGERVLRNALVAMGGLAHPTSQSTVFYGEKTVGDHVKAAFDAAGLSYHEASFAIMHACEIGGLSVGIFKRDDGVFAAVCGDCKAVFAHAGFVYEGDTIRPVAADDVIRFAKKGAIGVAIGVLEADSVSLLESEEALLRYLDGKLVFEGAAIVSYGMRDAKEIAKEFGDAAITLAVVCDTEEDKRYFESIGAQNAVEASDGLLYFDTPTRRELYDYIKSCREAGKTVLFEGSEPSHLALMKEADLSLAFGDTPKREAILVEGEPSLLANGAKSTRLFADWLLSGALPSIVKVKSRLRDAFFRTQSAVLYLFSVLATKLVPAIASIVTGRDIVTAIFFLLMGFGFDTLAVFAILLRHGSDGKAPYTQRAFFERLYATLGIGILTGGALLTFALLAERYFSLSAEVFSSVSLLAVSLIYFWFYYILKGKRLRASLSLGTVLTVGGVILLFVLLFARGSFGKFGFLFFAVTALLAAGLTVLSRLVLANISKNHPQKREKSAKKSEKTS